MKPEVVRCQLLVVSPLGWTQIRTQTGSTLLSGTTGLHGRGLLTLSISSRGVAPRKAPHAHRIERPLTAGGVCYPPLGIPGVMLAACPARVGVRVVFGHPHAPMGAWVLPAPRGGRGVLLAV